MRFTPVRRLGVGISLFAFFYLPSLGQGTLADYERANGLQERFRSAAVNMPGQPTWIPRTNRFWYRRTVAGGAEIVLIDADTLSRRQAFDHERFATSLSTTTGQKYTAVTLPTGQAANSIFNEADQKVTFVAQSGRWECELKEYKCTRLGDFVPE